MNRLTRRDFIRNLTAAACVGFGSASARASSKVLGSNDDIRIAIVGLRKKGKEHIDIFSKVPGVRIVALCDVDTEFLDFEARQFRDRNEKVATYVDYRKLLDDKDIDAVIIVTPDHWHALMTIWACQAGKDMYVEKPLSHNIWEGYRMVEAARKYNRIAQTGSQDRSDVGLRAAVEYIKQGNLGSIKLARAISYNLRESIGKVNGPQPIPASVDYNLFQGPASLTPLMRKNLHYDWHWFWDTGTGEVGNLGAHNIDESRWAIGHQNIAPKAISIGGRLVLDDDGQTANTQITFFDYKPVPMIYEVRNLRRRKGLRAEDHFRGTNFGMVVNCEGGYFRGGRGGGWVYDNNNKKVKQFPGEGGLDHQANFIQAMRSRKVSDLRADILEGHISAALCHMANISYRLGRKEPVEKIREQIAGNSILAESFESCLKHLKANEVDLRKEPLTIGPYLTFDQTSEKFVGQASDWANMLIRRNYREPFVVPDKV
ncbi:MAG: Gfo/Idh/MocA family oxidoreductase [Planctomycetes bacterium]|nr:Gfo/Idh/MocA family oxidoreductase [Planctomycetota bacterium]MBL7143467.1 Gfo/Idh/MocA family oxidoreductase [Phycisphaerae bacterium]